MDKSLQSETLIKLIGQIITETFLNMLDGTIKKYNYYNNHFYSKWKNVGCETIMIGLGHLAQKVKFSVKNVFNNVNNHRKLRIKVA